MKKYPSAILILYKISTRIFFNYFHNLYIVGKSFYKNNI
jgi:hypothetical protein